MKPITKRPRPVVADRNRIAADANIKEKICALKAIAQHAEVEVRSTGPHSTRQFCLWESPEFRLPGGNFEFGRTAPDTLRKNRDAAEAVMTLTAVCKAAKTEGNAKKSRKQNVIVVLKGKCDVHSSLRQIAEAELAHARRDLILAKNQVIRLNAQLSSHSAAAKQQVEELQVQISDLRAENAMLIAQRRKVVGMRKVPD